MAERLGVTQVTQIGIESTEGTAVAANRALPSLSIVPSVKAENQFFGSNGYKVDTIMAAGREWSESKVEGLATYDELVYLLSSLLAYAAPAQVGATTAYTWTHSPGATTADTIKTLTVEHGDAVRAHKSAGNRLNELTIAVGKNDTKLSGKLVGEAISDGITLTASPTAIDQIPILSTDWSIYADALWADLGTTQLLRAFNASLKIGPRFVPFFPIDRDQGTSFGGQVEQKTGLTLELEVEADAAGMGFVTAMRNSSKKFIRLEAVSDQNAGTATPYSASIDLSVAVKDIKEFKALDGGVYGYGLTLDAVYDSTSGKWIEAVVVNKRTAL